ncbi:MAG TPA: hypothetical protein VGI40_04735 [Pirellulaceae bacterium]|jgi:hypothetical protein
MLVGLHFSHVCYQDRGERMLVRRKFGRGDGGLWPLLLSTALAIYMAEFVVAAPRPHAPDDRAVAKVVEEFFASQPDYQNDDLITRSQIEKVVAKLVSDGVKISDPSSIAKRGLPDDSFLVREFATPNGKRFMRKIASRSGAYSHLDRLSTIPRGETTIRDLMRTKDGDKMIEYLATTKGGKNMGSMMAQARGGVDLNKPTGRIYTADDLLAALKDSMAKP